MLRSCTVLREASSAPKRMAPPVGKSSPAMRRKSVVLPEPEGPSRAISSPSRISRSSPRSTCTPRNSLVRLRIDTSIALSPSQAATGGKLRAMPPFEQALQTKGQEGQQGEQAGNGEGGHEVIFVVKNLHMQRHGVGEAANVTG